MDLVLKGTFLDALEVSAVRVRNGYLVCEGDVCGGFFDKLPERYASFPQMDCGDALVLPGFTDLHLHAPQFPYRGTAMDVELLEWLSRYTYPEESRYADPEYAEKGYSAFVDTLSGTLTTRACIFATIHTDATLLLMEKLAQAGLGAYVGKLNMDRNSPDSYRETTEDGISETKRWLEASAGRWELVKPMITPRFTPSVTDDYMKAIGELARAYGVPCQSHLNENHDEIAWVTSLCPDATHYADTYDRFGLLEDSVQAHCIYNTEAEDALTKARGVWIAHCPTSNTNVIAGICPAARYLREGYRIGLGSDVAGGHTLDLTKVMASAIQVSKLRWRYIDDTQKPLSTPEVFHMATAGGGSRFGHVGVFEKGYTFDAVIPDESGTESILPFTPEERLERLMYLGNGRAKHKFVAGRMLY